MAMQSLGMLAISHGIRHSGPWSGLLGNECRQGAQEFLRDT